MEIIKTVGMNGKGDLGVYAIVFLLSLVLFFATVVKFKSEDLLMLSLAGMVLGVICFTGAMLAPEETRYHAVVNDYEEVKNKGFLIDNHKKDNIYILKKAPLADE